MQKSFLSEEKGEQLSKVQVERTCEL